MPSETLRQSLFTCTYRQGVMVLTMAAEIRSCTYREKQEEYNQLMRELGTRSQPLVVFDLSECQLLDSVTVGIMIALSKAALQGNGDVGLSGLSEQIQRMLSRLMLLEPQHRRPSWNVYPNLDDAVVQLAADRV